MDLKDLETVSLSKGSENGTKPVPAMDFTLVEGSHMSSS